MGKIDDRYGFVYIWRDRKHNRYYVGSHWGYIDDGYICSSNWMRHSIAKRPTDFKRRILERVNDRSVLLDIEQKWLNLIRPEELRKRYYNITKSVKDPWYKYPEKVKTISEKISIRTKEAMSDPTIRAKIDAHYESRRGSKSSQETVEKQRCSMLKTMAEKFPIEERRVGLDRNSEELIKVYRQKSKELWADRTDEERAEIGAKISEALKGKKNRLGQTNSDDHNAKIRESNRATYAASPKDWITDGVTNKRIPKGSEPPDGWRLGKTVKSGWKKRSTVEA